MISRSCTAAAAVIFVVLICGPFGGEALSGFGSSCKYEDFYGKTKYYTCPRPGDDPKNKYCCGEDRSQTCCDKLLGIFDDDAVKEISENAGAIIGIVITIILVVIVGVIICCCCCSCCILNKMRKNRSNRNSHLQTATVQLAPSNAYPTQQPYPQQHQYVHTRSDPGPYPMQYQQGAPNPNQSYPAYNPHYPAGNQSTYPVGNQGPPYPVPEQPPPYSDFEKQPPFNPNYQQ